MDSRSPLFTACRSSCSFPILLLLLVSEPMLFKIQPPPPQSLILSTRDVDPPRVRPSAPSALCSGDRPAHLLQTPRCEVTVMSLPLSPQRWKTDLPFYLLRRLSEGDDVSRVRWGLSAGGGLQRNKRTRSVHHTAARLPAARHRKDGRGLQTTL